MADRIVVQEKTIAKNVVIFIIFTESGDHYHVIQLLRKDDYVETIYFIRAGLPVMVRQTYLPLNKFPKPNFEQFIETGTYMPN